MEASSHIFTAAKPVAAAAIRPHAPSVALPLAFMLTGLTALLVAVGWLVARPSVLATYHYNQYVIATTHLFVLGWICSIVMGAMYQLVPVALETKLYSEKLARCQLVFHVVGFTGMVWMFWVWNMKQVGHFGSVLAAGVGLFVYNIAQTLRRVPKWNVTATAVAAALAWISLTVAVGLCMAITKCVNEITFDPSSEHRVSAIIRGMQPIAGFMTRFDTISTMHAHAHLGGVGCFMMLIVGVSYKLIPMFTLSEVQSRRRAIYSVGLLNLGLAGSFVTILLHSRWKIAFACLVIAALTIYGVELSAIVRARKRRPLDWGIKYFLTATALLLPLSATAGILAWPGLPMNSFTNQLENMYGFLGFIGAVSLAIIGMLYQIIPFLVWFARYSREIGRAKVPSLADMYSPRLQAAGYWLYLAGLTLTCAATALASEAGVRVGCILLAGSLATVAANVARMLAHLYRPNIKPLAVRLSTIPAPI